MKVSNRPPTLRMITKLRECLEKGNKEPFLAENMKSSLPGLYKRGLVETRMELVHDKKLLCIYVSDLGKKFLVDESQN
ncbi:MAG: hypothetical protein ABI266_10685 [Ginsengibacter sp.]